MLSQTPSRTGRSGFSFSFITIRSSVIGALVAFVAVKPIQMRFDKKYILIFCWILGIIDGVCLVNLRFLDILPPNGSPWLLRLLVLNAIFTSAIGVVAGMLGPSLTADILDQQELQTDKRQEGMLFAAMSFSGKSISGFGVIVGGFIIDLLRGPRGLIRPWWIRLSSGIWVSLSVSCCLSFT